MKKIYEIIDNIVKGVINEAMYKKGDSFVIPGGEQLGRKIIAKKYNLDPEDFDYIAGGKFVYNPKPKSKKPKHGRKPDETEEQYLERVRQMNDSFAKEEQEIPGEEWRPVVNKGRYYGGNTDYSKSYEVSNMGRIRVIDYEDPMNSVITSGYNAPGKKARNFHLDIPGFKTTPPVHTLVADAWLPEPEGGIENYVVEHIDGDYHNNRADNLRYVPKKGRRVRKSEETLPENKNNRRMNMNKKYLKEGSTNPSDYNKWETIRERLGDSVLLSELFNYLSQDDIQDFIERIDNYYDLDLDDEENDFNESKKFNDLVDRINEAVVKKIHEAGHIYEQDEEGNVLTDSKSTYRGVPNSTFVWHGEWADPEIIYNKKKFNYWDVDDVLWGNFKEFCEENNIEATEEEFDKWVTPEEAEEALRTCAFAEV